MAKYILNVHHVAGIGLENESNLKKGDIIEMDEKSAEIHVKNGWLLPSTEKSESKGTEKSESKEKTTKK